MNSFNKILVPVDFSPCSQEALSVALTMAQKFDSQVTALHVTEPAQYVVPEMIIQMPGESGSTFEEYQSAAAEKAFEKFLRDVTVKPKTVIRPGIPTNTILGMVQNDSFDLIVMGTHGRGGLAHMLLGSIAEKIVRQSPVPVLTVRQSKKI